MKKLFVYGTLKEGGYYAGRFNGQRTNLGNATISNAEMFDLGNFPGVVLKRDGVVHGELHEYQSAVFKELNKIEGYDPKGNNNLYDLQKVDVKLTNGKIHKAFIYTFLRSIKNRKKVVNGFWPIAK